MQNESDAEFLTETSTRLGEFTKSLADLTTYVANFNQQKKLDTDTFTYLSRTLVSSVDTIDILRPLKDKLTVFAQEAESFVKLVYSADINEVRKYIETTKHLFKGACGVRHVDFIAHKPRETR